MIYNPESPHLRPEADGFWPHVPEWAYHRWPGCSKSRLTKLAMGTPEHLKDYLDGLVDEKPTDDKLFGSAGHVALMQPDQYDELVHVGPTNDRTTSRWKRWKKKSIAQDPWAMRIRPKDALEIERAVQAVDRHPDAGPLLRNCEHKELSLTWSYPVTVADGVEHMLPMKCRLDIVYLRANVLADWKFVQDARAETFERQVRREVLRYDWQDCLYTEGAATVFPQLDIEKLEFWFGLIERGRRPKVVMRRIKPKWPMMAYDELEALRTQWALCEHADTWPAYPPGVHDFDLRSSHEQDIRSRAARWQGGTW